MSSQTQFQDTARAPVKAIRHISDDAALAASVWRSVRPPSLPAGIQLCRERPRPDVEREVERRGRRRAERSTANRGVAPGTTPTGSFGRVALPIPPEATGGRTRFQRRRCGRGRGEVLERRGVRSRSIVVRPLVRHAYAHEVPQGAKQEGRPRERSETEVPAVCPLRSQSGFRGLLRSWCADEAIKTVSGGSCRRLTRAGASSKAVTMPGHRPSRLRWPRGGGARSTESARRGS